MDADLQHPVDQVSRMIERWREGYDVITTCRIDPKTLPFLRRLSSHIYYRTLSFLSDTELAPGSADFRLLDRKVVDVINGLKENDIVFRAVVPWLGFRTTSIQYTADERLHGTSKYTMRKMISLGMAGIVSTSIMPLRLATVLAGLISGITLAFVIYAFVVYFAFGHTVPGWASTVISINLIGSLQLLVLGVIGEYLGRVLRETRGRPAYVVKETNCQR
jgi:dolichol-phosphate mannosyltransferase